MDNNLAGKTPDAASLERGAFRAPQQSNGTMRDALARRILIASAIATLLPAVAAVQGTSVATISGVVTDKSGGVLPGVTVEVSSAVSIERVRTATTDARGEYRIVELRPGTYMMTFTRQGFASMRREEIELTSNFHAVVNAELRVGALEQPVTVSGANRLAGSFPTLVVLIVATLVWSACRYRTRQVAYQFDARVRERVNERMHIARELHDTLLQSFHAVMFRFQAAANVLPDRPLEAKQQLETALAHGTQAIREARDAVQGLRASGAVTNDLAVALSTLGEEVAAATQVNDAHTERARLDVAIHGTPRRLCPIVRDDIYRIGSEALRNAFWHARARRIEVEIRYDDHQFQLRVRDDGEGVDEAVLDGSRAGHFGLPGMRERAELIGGDFEVWSTAGMGTEVALTIPAAAIYATRGSRRHFWSFFRRSGASS
jgi:signal transduction histidine kinase